MFNLQSSSKPAIVFNNITITYDELINKSSILASKMSSYVKKGTIVIQIIHKSIEMIIGIVAIHLLGAIYCPFHPKDPNERLQNIIKLTDNTFILSHSNYKNAIQTSSTILYIDEELNTEQEIPKYQLDKSDCAYLISTSGSTGVPKLVSIEWNSIFNLMDGMTTIIGWNENEKVLQLARCSFDAQISEIYVTLLLGGTIIMPFEDWNYSLSDLYNMICNEQVSSIFLVPSLVNMLEKSTRNVREKFSNVVKTVIIGGEAVYPDIIKTLNILFPVAKIIVAYGPTETCVYATFFDTTGYSFKDKWMPLGKPLPGYEIKIENGELHIFGKGVMKEYINNKEQTQKALIYLENGDKGYRTGDLVKMENDILHFEGRIDFQVKCNGQRLELGEIESTLNNYTDISNSTVLKKGEDLIAYIILKDGIEQSSLLTRNIRNHCKESLPQYMIPLRWMYITEFPLTTSGKIDRKSFPEPELDF
jgi:amino acid adenylation domain-containing protein